MLYQSLLFIKEKYQINQKRTVFNKLFLESSIHYLRGTKAFNYEKNIKKFCSKKAGSKNCRYKPTKHIYYQDGCLPEKSCHSSKRSISPIDFSVKKTNQSSEPMFRVSRQEHFKI